MRCRRFVAAHGAQAAALDALFRACGVGHTRTTADPAAEVRRIAAFYDRAAEAAPDASVAAYTLGDPELTTEATREIIDWLVAIGALTPISTRWISAAALGG